MASPLRVSHGAVWRKAVRVVVIALITLVVAGLIVTVVAYYSASVTRAYSGIVPSWRASLT